MQSSDLRKMQEAYNYLTAPTLRQTFCPSATHRYARLAYRYRFRKWKTEKRPRTLSSVTLASRPLRKTILQPYRYSNALAFMLMPCWPKDRDLDIEQVGSSHKRIFLIRTFQVTSNEKAVAVALQPVCCAYCYLCLDLSSHFYFSEWSYQVLINRICNSIYSCSHSILHIFSISTIQA